MSHKKQDFNIPFRELKKRIKQQRQEELDGIVHEGKKLLLAFLCNPLTYLLI